MAQSSSAELPDVPTSERPRAGAIALRGFLPLGAILVLAVALRLWGITWALPNQDRFYTYHPDEGVNVVQGVLDPETRTPRPHLDLQFYNYGGLYFYVWQGAVAVNRAYGAIALPHTGQPNSPATDSIAAMILIGRLLTVLFGALTAWALYAAGARLWGRSAGLAAALIWAVAPVAVVHGHYATVDVAATFFVALTLAVTAKGLSPGGVREAGRASEDASEGPERAAVRNTKPLLVAALCAGLAAATKYNCGLVLFAPLAATMLPPRGLRERLWLLPAIVAASAVGFLIGCPGALVNPTEFMADFRYELQKTQEGMGLLFAGTGNGWWYHVASSLRLGLGVPLLLLSAGGVVLAAARRSRQDLILLAFAVPYYLLIGYAQVRFLRYILPLVPVLALLAGRLLAEADLTDLARKSVRLAGGAVILFTLILCLALVRMFTLPDPRDRAKAFIEALPEGHSVAFVWTPWYQSPPLSPDFTLPNPFARRQSAQSYPSRRLILPAENTEWDRAILSAPLPDAFAVSEFETGDAERLGMEYARPFFKLWRERYTAHVFDKSPSVLGIGFGKPDYTPNDWLYPNPRTTVYTLNPAPVILSNEPPNRGLRQPSRR